MSLHQRLFDDLRTQILDGTLAPGSQLPPELVLVEQHGMSRGTVRQAMNALVAAGLIERVQGRGTFVRQRVAAAQSAAERRIGVVLPYLRDEQAVNILVGIEAAAKARGYQVSFAHSDERADQQSTDVMRLRADRVAGIIVYPVSNQQYDAAIWRLHADQVPLVLIDRYYPDLPTDVVAVQNTDGAYRATEHLIILGYRKIGFVHTAFASFDTTSVRDRYAGYRQAMDDYGLPIDPAWIVQREQSYNSREVEWYRTRFFTRPNRPEAVIAVNDNEAIGLLKAAAECGLPVPEAFAVVGFDNLALGRHVQPALTTVSQPSMELGLRAGHLLVDRIEGYRGPIRHVALPVSLVVRDSCGARLKVRSAAERDALVASDAP
jgi:DNA-binding LacI/PurR family transcriptional regulator